MTQPKEIEHPKFRYSMNNENKDKLFEKDKIFEVSIVILKGLSLIALLLVAFIIIEALADSHTTAETECKTQCSKQDMTFEEYTFSIYGSSICNCKDDKGLIKTIYSK